MDWLIAQQALAVFEAVWTPLMLDSKVSSGEVRIANNLWMLALDIAEKDPALASHLKKLTEEWLGEVLYKDIDGAVESISEYRGAVLQALELNSDDRPRLLARAIKEGIVDGRGNED